MGKVLVGEDNRNKEMTCDVICCFSECNLLNLLSF